MTYRMACNEPDFMQSVPAGRWTLIPDALFPACYRWRNDDTGQTVLVPAIWYTGTARSRASYFRYAAEQAEGNAKRLDAENKPWSAREASERRKSAKRLRFSADLFESFGYAVTGHVTDTVDAAVMLLSGFALGMES